MQTFWTICSDLNIYFGNWFRLKFSWVVIACTCFFFVSQLDQSFHFVHTVLIFSGSFSVKSEINIIITCMCVGTMKVFRRNKNQQQQQLENLRRPSKGKFKELTTKQVEWLSFSWTCWFFVSWGRWLTIWPLTVKCLLLTDLNAARGVEF